MNDKIESLISKFVNNMQPSGSILIATNNETIYQQSFGYSDMSKGIRMSIDTQMLVGSVTKQFTAVAILNGLYSKKSDIKSDLNKTLVHYLPKKHAIWTGSMPDWANSITIHQLLVHSSGIPNYTNIPDFDKQDLQKSSDILALVKNLPLEFKSGEKFAYCNSGYILLGEIIQVITQCELNDYLQTAFFEPLNMCSTYFATSGTVDSLIKSDPRFSKLARGYSFEADEKNAELREVTDYVPMQIPGAGGSLISTAEDLLKWNNALYSGRVIPNNLLDLMLQPHIVTESEKDHYGYGIEVFNSDTLGLYYSHRGGIPGFHSMLSYIPSLELSIIILENIVANRDSLRSEIDEIKAGLDQSLSEDGKAKQVDELLEQRHPSIAENNKKYMLQPIHNLIIEELEAAQG